MNPAKLLKQFQQAQEKLQQEIHALEVTASAGGDMVTVRMNGRKEVLSVRIDPEVVSRDDVEMLQDLIAAACNECGRKVDAEVEAKVSGMTAGMKLPIPGMGF